jgi:hypothetical protein
LVKAHIERNDLGQNVKVYLYEDTPSGRAFYWPLEYEEFGWSWFRYHEGDHTHDREPAIRPAIEMSTAMWNAFTEAMLETAHVRVDALDIVARTLEREQGRVDKMLDAVLRTPLVLTGQGGQVIERG